MTPPLKSFLSLLLAGFFSMSFASCEEAAFSSPSSAFERSLISMREIGMKVWDNESHGTLEGLIFWNPKEDFLSLGIGHFIWYPQGKEGPFEATFPALLTFLKEQGKVLPHWLASARSCPWKDRASFLKKRHHKKVVELRAVLASTVELQALFLAQRFTESKQKLLPLLSVEKQELLSKLERTPEGLYALIDYVNFKGTGLCSSERYKGMGWGLLQVLEGMDPSKEDLCKEFTRSAKTVLERRVSNSPANRKETSWLKGWHKRLETYTKPFSIEKKAL